MIKKTAAKDVQTFFQDDSIFFFFSSPPKKSLFFDIAVFLCFLRNDKVSGKLFIFHIYVFSYILYKNKDNLHTYF
jgi:hypothetical protein